MSITPQPDKKPAIDRWTLAVHGRGSASLLAIAFIATSASVNVHAQPRQNTGSLYTSASVIAVGPVYPVTDRGKASYVVYAGETLLLRVSVINESNVAIRSSSSVGWPAALEIDLENPKNTGSSRLSFDVISVDRVVGNTGRADATLIGAEDGQEARLQMKLEGISPGAYRIRVTLDREALSSAGPWPPSRMVATQSVEIHEIVSAYDRWNVLWARGVRARFEGRTGEARAHFSQLITEHPASVAAWYEMGKAWIAEGDCKQASTAFQRAEAFVRSKSDPYEESARRGQQHQLPRAMKADLARCR